MSDSFEVTSPPSPEDSVTNFQEQITKKPFRSNRIAPFDAAPASSLHQHCYNYHHHHACPQERTGNNDSFLRSDLRDAY
ncbi:hypothetical protein MJO28_004733 [Puccinia striiformis f. sp. tritici]|uniref:Uncharacterized protein n=1 Tax=Puccinia striiformis f. sp. tritici TaxID=168172 RepID=A0ACC0EIA9_9BASI|nr:hypothetical protein MJO28_004733 [Puccinia striiformis f. sp. tritici]